MILFEAITDFSFYFSWGHYKLKLVFLLSGFYLPFNLSLFMQYTFNPGSTLKEAGCLRWWEMLLSDFGSTNWKDVTVFYPLVEHSRIQDLHVFLGYPVFLAFLFLAFLFLCFMWNTQKITKCHTSALGIYIHILNMYIFNIYLCYFFFFFSLIFCLFSH